MVISSLRSLQSSYFSISSSKQIGENATFYCNGIGSHLYWFIDGVNTQDMTTEETTDRGLHFTGDYNQVSPYSGYCYDQTSYLTMAGICLNNNSGIYCFILGRYGYGGRTSYDATMTINWRYSSSYQCSVTWLRVSLLLWYSTEYNINSFNNFYWS